MIPVLGFCNLSVFGGYSIYFPELYPTRLRSTGVGFCYNVGRIIAAMGPFTLVYLSSALRKCRLFEPLSNRGYFLILRLSAGNLGSVFCARDQRENHCRKSDAE